MKIKKITYQNRRDFLAEYECESCGYIVGENEAKKLYGWGYDDRNYHDNVIPKFICPKCKKMADSTYRPLQTKYPEWQQV